jgi:glycine/D-amino acid oxidase-like deaminating enzyme
MHVGVLGGGLQGCCTALALAERGITVTILDRNNSLMSRAAVANEGKIHLGYMYAGDPTFATARMMIRGALAFAPFFLRYLGLSYERFKLSSPAAYVVHRDSQHDADEVLGYARRVHELIGEAASRERDAYFGRGLHSELRDWSREERASAFDADIAVAAFDSPEVAVDPVVLTRLLGQAINTHHLIEVRLNRTVLSGKNDGNAIAITSECKGERTADRFDHAVNCLWDGRLAFNETLGLRAERPWLHRLKYGVSFRWPTHLPRPKSATFVSGPFGEIVCYDDGLTYLTWYPVCQRGLSSDLAPPQWDTYPAEPLRSSVLEGTCRALGEFVKPLRDLEPANLPDAKVKGGVIVAWGKTDIYDPQSELHCRSAIGITSHGNFHSIDPGKLTMAPYFAELCAERIAPVQRTTGNSRPWRQTGHV